MMGRTCGADTLVREMLEARVDKATPNKMLAAIVRPFAIDLVQHCKKFSTSPPISAFWIAPT